MREITPDDVVETQIDQAIEDKHAKLTDLGWHNAGGETAAKIDAVEKVCRAKGHHPVDKDYGPAYRGLDHRVSCDLCGYVYHYDSSD